MIKTIIKKEKANQKVRLSKLNLAYVNSESHFNNNNIWCSHIF